MPLPVLPPALLAVLSKTKAIPSLLTTASATLPGVLGRRFGGLIKSAKLLALGGFLGPMAIRAFIAAGSLIAGYIIADLLIPDWFLANHFANLLTTLPKSVLWILELMNVFNGIALLLTALVCAWCIKKIPPLFFVGALLRGVTESSNVINPVPTPAPVPTPPPPPVAPII